MKNEPASASNPLATLLGPNFRERLVESDSSSAFDSIGELPPEGLRELALVSLAMLTRTNGLEARDLVLAEIEGIKVSWRVRGWGARIQVGDTVLPARCLPALIAALQKALPLADAYEANHAGNLAALVGQQVH